MFHIPYQNKSLMNNRNKLLISRHFVFGVNIINNIWNFAFNSKSLFMYKIQVYLTNINALV